MVQPRALARAAYQWLMLSDAGQAGSAVSISFSIFRFGVPTWSWVDGPLAQPSLATSKSADRPVEISQRRFEKQPRSAFIAVIWFSAPRERNGVVDARRNADPVSFVLGPVLLPERLQKCPVWS